MNDEKILIVRCGEVALKGMNKPYFERILVERIRKNLSKINGAKVSRKEGLIFVRVPLDSDMNQVAAEVSKVFGVSSVSPALEVESDLEAIGSKAVEFMNTMIENEGVKTFKVEAKRADKNFPIKSPEIAAKVGASVLKGCKVLKVDVHEPDCHLFIDLRADRTYIYTRKINGLGGLPLGTNGRGMVLLSGGIDSPVAAWMMAKRGMVIDAVHFHSYPYTSPRAQQKVEELAEIVSSYCGRINMTVINLLPIQEEIVSNCPEDETTILVRRFMMRIAEKIAVKQNALMLITGENLGQVASQTAEALVVTDQSVSMPVMRPLIGMDKVEIMDMARRIGTYEKSIEPYEDCCTVFLPKHPVTKPRLEKILKSESKLDVEKLVEMAVDSAEQVQIG
ncbi:thiamine biosynthesis protein ThiI [Clostridiales bacterium S5-A14a]|nr:thiamine biosynthesis protein ThiI [Clostridiales bacterium S5-A14a]